MGKTTGIDWCDHTFSPWWGCEKVAPECDNCYAEAWDARFGGNHWGPKAERRVFGAKHWNEPRRWNEAARVAGVRRRVFCASMGDVFDVHAPDAERSRLWELIHYCRDLDWLLLTKRIANVKRMLPWMKWGDAPPWPHVWLGVSAGTRKSWDTFVPVLRDTPAAVRFISAEPLLEYLGTVDLTGIDWVITGAESGRGWRPMQEQWVRSLRDQCEAAGVPLFYKQRGDGRGGKIKLPVLDGRQHVEWPQRDRRG